MEIRWLEEANTCNVCPCNHCNCKFVFFFLVLRKDHHETDQNRFFAIEMDNRFVAALDSPRRKFEEHKMMNSTASMSSQHS